MIHLKQLLTEGKNIKIPIPKHETIQFSVHGSTSGTIVFLPKTSKELDKVQDIIASPKSDALIIQKEILKYLESKLNIPIDYDFDYVGAGYGFKIDMYSLINKLK